MDIKEEARQLLNTHNALHDELIQIPSQREMIYIVEEKEDMVLGKPRFKISEFQWSHDLLARVRDHLQEIWNFFDAHSYWFDETIKAIIDQEKRRLSKHSVLFLLERDAWETDEVYGLYLMEKGEKFTLVSYYRRESKVQEFVVPSTEDSEIENWIRDDVIHQIEQQFEFLWGCLETEIKSCVKETFHLTPSLSITSDYLKDQLEKTRDQVDIWPEAALLSLGRIIEMWLLLQLKYTNTPYQMDLIRHAHLAGILSDSEVKIIRKVRRKYNSLKHKTHYTPTSAEIAKLLESLLLKLKNIKYE